MLPVTLIKKKPLALKFYQRDTTTVTKELLGLKLCVKHTRKTLAAYIVETEAYLGVTDRAQEAIHWP